MPAPKGNRFWEARSSHGRKPIFAKPEDLEDACTQYFTWNADNPLMVHKVTQTNGEQVDMWLEKPRAMTLRGLYGYIGIHASTWAEFRHKEGFSDITANIEDSIYQQKLEGASADIFNANIIARELALVDKTETRMSLTDLSDEELERKLAQLEQG